MKKILLLFPVLVILLSCHKKALLKKEAFPSSHIPKKNIQKEVPVEAENREYSEEEENLVNELLNDYNRRNKRQVRTYLRFSCGITLKKRKEDTILKTSSSSLYSSGRLIRELGKLLCNIRKEDKDSFHKFVDEHEGLWINAKHHQTLSVIKLDLHNPASEVFSVLYRNIKDKNTTPFSLLSLREKTKGENAFIVDIEFLNSYQVRMSVFSRKTKNKIFSPVYTMNRKLWWLEHL